MHQVLSVTVIFVPLILSVYGHTYHTGSCPSVEPERAFDMRRFLGEWYAIQKTSTASTCLIYNITMDQEPGVYKIEQTSQHFALGLTPLKHQYSYTGEITVPDIDVTGKMTVKFPLSVLGSSTFTVFMTDYVTYAGVFSCQKVGFAHRRSATILSRTKTLDKMYIDKLRTRLASFLVDPFELSIINQTGCPKNPEEGVDLHIDDETFSAKSVANVIRKGGEKIGDGFEYVVGAGKKLYHRLRSDDSTHENYEVSTVQPLSIPSGEIDAEWVRF